MHITGDGDHLFVCCRDEQASKSLTRRIKATELGHVSSHFYIKDMKKI